MLRIRSVEPLDGHCVRLILTDGSVVGRDIDDLRRGPVFEPIRSDEALFRRVRVRRGTIVWPDADILAPPRHRHRARVVGQLETARRGRLVTNGGLGLLRSLRGRSCGHLLKGIGHDFGEIRTETNATDYFGWVFMRSRFASRLRTRKGQRDAEWSSGDAEAVCVDIRVVGHSVSSPMVYEPTVTISVGFVSLGV